MAGDTRFYRDKHVLVTGGLGFLGSTLATALVRKQARVTLVDGLLPLYGGNVFNIEPIRKRVAVTIADIRDEAAMDQLVRDQDVIFHIAAQTSHVDSIARPLEDLDMNARGTLILLEACRQQNPTAKLVYIGTRAEYGCAQYLPVDEAHPLEPIDIYGVHKVAGEWYHRIYHRLHRLPVVCVRLGNTYGPRHQMKHPKYGILNWFIRLALEGKRISLYGGGQQQRDYLYVDDAVDALLRIGALRQAKGQAYNLGSGESRSLRDLVKLIIKIVGRGSYRVMPWPSERRGIETGDFQTDIRKARQELGWAPTTLLEEGLHRTVTFYRRYRRHYW